MTLVHEKKNLKEQININNLSESLLQSAKKTLKYFEKKMDDRGSFGETAKDISCYFKSPMLFIAAEKTEEAVKILNYIKNNFMQDDGSFRTSKSIKSKKPEYSEYLSYIDGWVTRAANQLNFQEISELSDEYLSRFYTQDHGFATNEIDNLTAQTDILSSAHNGLINLEKGNLNRAILVGIHLCEIFNNQPELSQKFYLRANAENQIASSEIPEEKIPFYVISTKKNDQLHFMIGYPSAFLSLLYLKTNNETFLEYAKRYLDFSLSCHESLYECNHSHKLAWAASLLYKITEEEKYLLIIKKITDYFLKTQSVNGLWYENTDLETAYDQSAEISCWFIDIAKNITNCLKKKELEESEKTLQNVSSYWKKSVVKYGAIAIVTTLGLYALHKNKLCNDKLDLNSKSNFHLK